MLKIILIKLIFIKLTKSQINWNGNWAMGCDFNNNDLKNERTRGEDCYSKCENTLDCTHFTWTDYNGGTCWMKYGTVTKSDAIEASSEIVCGIVLLDNKHTINWNGEWAMGCDFNNHDLKNERTRGEDCSNACLKTSGCTHYSWTNYDGGTCWMKYGPVSKSDAVKANLDRVCGIISLKEQQHPLKGIFGVTYSSSYASINFLDDWFTLNYKNIYDNVNTKRSLNHLRTLGFNNIRSYYLDPNRDHSDFLNICDKLGLSVEIGISNNLLDRRDIIQIKKLINSVKNFKSVKIYTVGNNYENSIYNIISVIQTVYSIDSSKFIMHSSIFDKNFKTAQKIYENVPNSIKPKYIVGINMYFYNYDPKTHGNVIQSVIDNYYRHPVLKDSYLVVTEYGTNNDNYDAIINFSFGNLECLKNYDKYLGYELYSYSNEAWKGSENGENNYGILTEDGKEKSTYYAILNFRNNPDFEKYIKNFL